MKQLLDTRTFARYEDQVYCLKLYLTFNMTRDVTDDYDIARAIADLLTDEKIHYHSENANFVFFMYLTNFRC